MYTDLTHVLDDEIYMSAGDEETIDPERVPDITEEEEFEEYMDRLLERATHARRDNAQHRDFEYTDTNSIFDILPGSDEYPLWRIECRVSLEHFMIQMKTILNSERDKDRHGGTERHVYLSCGRSSP